MKTGIFGKFIQPEYIGQLKLIIQLLEQQQEDIYIYKPFYESLITEHAFHFEPKGLLTDHRSFAKLDLVFSIGGDGTFLETVSFVRDSNVPIVGFNSGRLGFLADISVDEIEKALCQIHQKKYRIEECNLIEINTPNSLFSEFNYALNDVTFHKVDTSSMITVHSYINGDFLNSYWADGLVIATPTGSTAYSLSAGGPIVTPGSDNFLITPIAPHNLTVRPIVIPNNYELTFKIEGRGENFMISLDSRSQTELFGTTLKIKKANFTIKVLKLADHNFYSTLRNKMMWGIDKRN